MTGKPFDAVCPERDAAAMSGEQMLDAMTADELSACERRLVRRIDLRMGVLVLVFLANHIDRGVLGSARLQGFQRDLAIDDTQWAILVRLSCSPALADGSGRHLLRRVDYSR